MCAMSFNKYTNKLLWCSKCRGLLGDDRLDGGEEHPDCEGYKLSMKQEQVEEQKQEQAEPLSTEKKYTEKDMLAAFRHGIEYEPYFTDRDVSTESIPEKNRPFFGWLKIRDKYIKDYDEE